MMISDSWNKKIDVADDYNEGEIHIKQPEMSVFVQKIAQIERKLYFMVMRCAFLDC